MKQKYNILFRRSSCETATAQVEAADKYEATKLANVIEARGQLDWEFDGEYIDIIEVELDDAEIQDKD